MLDGNLRGYEVDFLVDIGLSLLAGFLIGAERESRGKSAGISTHCFVILKSESDARITNLTTAAAIWFAASIGMAIGFNFYFMAIIAIAFAVLVPRIPHISKIKDVADR